MELPTSGNAALDEAIALSSGPVGALGAEDVLGPPADLAKAYVRGAVVQAIAGRSHEWYLRCDPLDVLFLGASAPTALIGEAPRFGNERTRWLRSLRGTRTWAAVEGFVRTAVAAAHEFGLPLDDIRLVLVLVGRIEGHAWARLPLAAEHLPAVGDPGLGGFRMPEPPADAAERSAAFWRSLHVELPCDGTVIDTLRAALRDLGHRPGPGGLAGIPPRRLGVCLAHRLGVRDLEEGEDHWWWLLGFPEDSPLYEPGRVLAVADLDGLDCAAALACLLGTPGSAEVFDPAHARWHGAPGTDLPALALELGEPIAAAGGKVWLPDGTVRRIDRADLARQIRAARDTIGLHGVDPGGTLPSGAVPEVPRQAVRSAFERIGLSAAWMRAFDLTGLVPGFDGAIADPESAARWDAAVAEHRTAHPDESGDPEDDRRRLRRSMAQDVVRLARRTPEFGASLLSRLAAPGDDLIAGIRLALDDVHDELRTALSLDPETVRRAGEHARAWSGTSLEAEVRAAAQGAPPSEAVLLVVLAALSR